MNALRTARLCVIPCVALWGALAAAQPQAAPAPRPVVFLDPAHGGADPGARISDQLDEKTATLALAAALRPALAQAGFTVLSSRDAELPVNTTLPLDQRAGLANHAQAAACLVLHVTAAGSGVHLATSTLDAAAPTTPGLPAPWDTAQAGYVERSRALANELGEALLQGQLPVLLGRTLVPPLDNLTCPAVLLEVAPLRGADPRQPDDATYQLQLARAVAAGLRRFHQAQSGDDHQPAKPRPHPAAPARPEPQGDATAPRGATP
ncbi:MAG: N-acetylmuramoyl-L-alanine amidase [Acidobacteriota bacterium]|nr:N-acetylmuramoyl-L-alanine amidase [Acidobacteriota bacterium]